MLDHIPIVCWLSGFALLVHRHHAFACSPNRGFLYSVFGYRMVFDICMNMIPLVHLYLCTSNHRSISVVYPKVLRRAWGKLHQIPQEQYRGRFDTFWLCHVALVETDGCVVSSDALPLGQVLWQSGSCSCKSTLICHHPEMSYLRDFD